VNITPSPTTSTARLSLLSFRQDYWHRTFVAHPSRLHPPSSAYATASWTSRPTVTKKAGRRPTWCQVVSRRQHRRTTTARCARSAVVVSATAAAARANETHGLEQCLTTSYRQYGGAVAAAPPTGMRSIAARTRQDKTKCRVTLPLQIRFKLINNATNIHRSLKSQRSFFNFIEPVAYQPDTTATSSTQQ